jgi:glycosyltransferase involved in cell wall biosynthesis
MESLPRGMAIIVLDHQSDDATADVARAHGASVVARPFHGFVEARRFALAQVHTPWTFMVDADEVLDQALQDAIVQASEDVDGYFVSRTTYFCGRPMRMWTGERLLRLFRTNRVDLSAAPAAGGDAQLHERWSCKGPTRELDGVLHHYSYPTRAAYREKFARYTSIEAEGIHGTPLVLLRQLLLVPMRFYRNLLVRGGILDGMDGVRVAWYSAAYPAAVALKALRG